MVHIIFKKEKVFKEGNMQEYPRHSERKNAELRLVRPGIKIQSCKNESSLVWTDD